jgi:hypothetical protein
MKRTMNSDTAEQAIADRGTLGLIGLLLAAATLMVTVTAAVAVTGYRDDAQSLATLSAVVK